MDHPTSAHHVRQPPSEKCPKLALKHLSPELKLPLVIKCYECQVFLKHTRTHFEDPAFVMQNISNIRTFYTFITRISIFRQIFMIIIEYCLHNNLLGLM
jgi:hypothetical protein